MRPDRLLAKLLLVASTILAAPASLSATLEDEVLAFEAQDRISPPPAGSVVVTGSSSIRLWTTIASDLSPLSVIPRGFGGSTTSDLDVYLERLVLVYQPRAVVIYEGDNDTAGGTTPQQIADKMASILARISARLPNARVYVIALKPSPLRWPLWTQALQVNQLLSNLCASDARYVYVDIVPVLLGSNGQPRPDYYQSDQLHLNAAGYQAWSSVIRPVLHGQQLQPLPADTTAPSAPQGLQATALSRSSVDLRWTAARDTGSGLGGYRVSRGGVAIATTTSIRFTDTGLAANTAYSYTVTALDRATPAPNQSSPSLAASATTLADPAPTVSLAATPTAVASGTGSTLAWNSTNATSCAASGGWSGSRGITGTSATGPLTTTTLYTLVCTGSGGSASSSASVTVNPPPVVSLVATPATVAAGGAATLSWSSSNASGCTASGGWSGARATSGSASTGPVSTGATYTLTCSGAGGSGSGSTTVTVAAAPPPLPTISLAAVPAAVVVGASSLLTWSASNAANCTASGGWSGVRPTSGSESTGAHASRTAFSLNCTGAGGTASATATVDVTAPPPAPTLTLQVTPAAVVHGGTTRLEWNATGVTSCSASEGWSGTRQGSGVETSAPLSGNTSFSLACSGPGGTVVRRTVVTVTRPPPTLTLAANPASVTAGATSRLTWTSSDASDCSASGDWSGERAASGDEATASLVRTATFTLACTGAGGRVEASAVVTVASQAVSAAPSSGAAATSSGEGSGGGEGGGGGAIGWPSVLAFAALLALRTRRRERVRQ